MVIGESLWRSRFGADPSLIGRGVRLGDRAHTIVGVMPASFGFPINHGLWVPLRVETVATTRGSGPDIRIFGRLSRTVPALKATTASRQLRLKSGSGGAGVRFGFMSTAIIVGKVAVTVLCLTGIAAIAWDSSMNQYAAAMLRSTGRSTCRCASSSTTRSRPTKTRRRAAHASRRLRPSSRNGFRPSQVPTLQLHDLMRLDQVNDADKLAISFFLKALGVAGGVLLLPPASIRCFRLRRRGGRAGSGRVGRVGLVGRVGRTLELLNF